MSKSFILLASTVLACYGLTKSALSGNQKLPLYRVYKIDSINSYYLIYAKKGDSLFKIVSEKQHVESGENIRENIRLNKNYPFKLHSSLQNFYIGKTFIRGKDPHVGGYYYNDSTLIRLERDTINDLFYADNIKGLYFIKN